MRMLDVLGWAALGTGFTFGMTALGAAMVFFLADEPKPRAQRVILGFAAGVMTAASVWSLLIPAIEQAEAEGRFPGWLPAAVVTIGNGFNDIQMSGVADLSICVIGKEGCCGALLAHCDVVVTSIHDALDLLLKTHRLRATLRT